MGEIQPFTCKTAKKAFVGYKSLTLASQVPFQKYNLYILELLYCNMTLAKIMNGKMGEILCRRYTVQVFVGLQVGNGSFPRFHIRDVICTGLTVLQHGIGKKQWT